MKSIQIEKTKVSLFRSGKSNTKQYVPFKILIKAITWRRKKCSTGIEKYIACYMYNPKIISWHLNQPIFDSLFKYMYLNKSAYIPGYICIFIHETESLASEVPYQAHLSLSLALSLSYRNSVKSKISKRPDLNS